MKMKITKKQKQIIEIAVAVVALILVVNYLGLLSVVGSYPTFQQDVTNITTGSSEVITWSTGPDSYGGLAGNGGEIDVFYNLISVQIDGQTLLSYVNTCPNTVGGNCWAYQLPTGVNIGGNYVTSTLTTITNFPNGGGTYYHCSGGYPSTSMCDATHANVPTGTRFNVPKEAIYTLTVNNLPAGTHTVTTQMAGNQAVNSAYVSVPDPTGKYCGGTNVRGTLTDTFTVTTPVCSDGTAYTACSTTKPKYCNAGTLIDKASVCGCPSGLVVSGDTCVNPQPTTCSDGTAYAACSATKPKYCNAGTLVDKATVCGCSTGQIANGDACITISPPPAPTFDFWGIIAGILCFFKQLFGQVC